MEDWLISELIFFAVELRLIQKGWEGEMYQVWFLSPGRVTFSCAVTDVPFAILMLLDIHYNHAKMHALQGCMCLRIAVNTVELIVEGIKCF